MDAEFDHLYRVPAPDGLGGAGLDLFSALIDHKCHDLKHQIRALEHVSEGERSDYIRELEDAIGIYDAVVETGNEVVNTIISEKTLICGRRDIRLSCIVDASHLDFMATLDIYALLGNALDNAIENVSKYQDTDKRIISLTIRAVGDFLSRSTIIVRKR